MHEREPIRLARTSAQYAVLLGVPKMDVRVLVRDGGVAAYLMTGRACNKRGIMEYGGLANDIGALLADVVASQPAIAPMPLVIHHTHPELARLLQGIGVPFEPLPCSKGPGCEMIFEVRPGSVPTTVRQKLFIWGLDVT